MDIDVEGASVSRRVSWLHSRELEEDVEAAARSNAPVLISGEPGVGKLFVARAIHARSGQRRAPFIRMSGAADRSLIPHGATVAIEEIDQLSPLSQAALEQLLEGGAGVSVRRNPDIRIVSTMTANVRQTGRPRGLSERLFYRLNTIHLVIPPLRERQADIPRLVRHWVHDREQEGHRTPTFSTEANERLMAHTWPQNMRELKAALGRLAARNGASRVSATDVDLAVERP